MTATAPPPAEPSDPAEQAGSPDLAGIAWRLMRQFVDANGTRREVRERLGLGAGSGRIKVLFLLREQPRTLAQLADAHGVDRPYATIIVDKLEQLGFVERQPHPSDRRSKIVSLTPAGRDAAALADAILGEPPAALRELDPGQLAELVGLLSRLTLGPGRARYRRVRGNGEGGGRCRHRGRSACARASGPTSS